MHVIRPDSDTENLLTIRKVFPSLRVLQRILKRLMLALENSAISRKNIIDLCKTINLNIGSTLLGSGSYSKVFSGKFNEKDVAVKTTICRKKSDKTTAVNEINILKQIKHDNIVKMYASVIDMGAFELPAAVVVVLSLCDAPVTSISVNKVCKDILQALEYIHGLGFIHRDIKPENILVRHNNAILSDFSFCIKDVGSNDGVTGDSLSRFCGTPYYMSPEGLDGKNVSSKSDIWSFGITLIELIARVHPFAKAINIEHLSYLISLDKDIAKTDFVRNMVSIKPSERLSASELLLLMKSDSVIL